MPPNFNYLRYLELHPTVYKYEVHKNSIYITQQFVIFGAARQIISFCIFLDGIESYRHGNSHRNNLREKETFQLSLTEIRCCLLFHAFNN